MARRDLPKVGESLGVRVVDYIDEGGFAKVFKAQHVRTSVELAIKRLIEQEPRNAEILRKESVMQRTLDHPFVLHCYGMIREGGVSSVVCDYVQGRSLLAAVNEKHGLPEEAVQMFTVQLLAALRYLHEERAVAHRDIKLENVLVERDSVRLIDFGFSRALDPEMATRCGSLPYAAPELLLGKKYSKAVDVWSLGVVVYTMLAGHLPFSGSTNELVDRITHHPPALMRRKVSGLASDFVMRMLTKDPRSRLTIDKAVEHPFIAEAENAWLLTEAVLERPEFRVWSADGGLDEAVVLDMVDRGYDREKVQLSNTDEIRDETAFAYELLKVAAIHGNLAQLVNDRVAARRFRLGPGSGPRHAATLQHPFKPIREPQVPPLALLPNAKPQDGAAGALGSSRKEKGAESSRGKREPLVFPEGSRRASDGHKSARIRAQSPA